MQVAWSWYICLVTVYNSATTVCTETLISERAVSEYSSVQCIWERYFSLTSSTMKQVPASYTVPPILLDPFPTSSSCKFHFPITGQYMAEQCKQYAHYFCKSQHESSVWSAISFWKQCKNVMFCKSSIITLYVHLQPSLPTVLTVTGVISDAVNTRGVILTIIVLALIYVSSTVITLKSCTAVASIWFRRSRAMSAIKTFILKA